MVFAYQDATVFVKVLFLIYISICFAVGYCIVGTVGWHDNWNCSADNSSNGGPL